MMADAGGSTAMRASMEALREERIGVTLKLDYSAGGDTNVGGHHHTMHISGPQLAEMDAGQSVRLTTSLDNGHSHDVNVSRDVIHMRAGIPTRMYHLLQCDEKLNGAVRMCGNRTGYADAKAQLREEVLALGPTGFWS